MSTSHKNNHNLTHNLTKQYNGTEYYSSPGRAAALKKALITEWTLSANIKDFSLVSHFILYWDASYFRAHLEDSGCIYKDGRLFKVHYHNCTALDCVKHMGTMKQVALSFRVPHHKYSLHPIVLVSCAASVMHSHRKKEEERKEP